MEVVDRFYKMTYFIPCREIHDTSRMTDLYLKEVVHLHVIPQTITSTEM